MTRDEAKWVLELIRDRYSSVDVDRLSLTDAETDAINMAIEALEQCEMAYEHGWTDAESEYRKILERNRGEWMYLYEDNYKCSICGSWWCCTNSQIDEMNYCPNCGADMRGEE